MGPLLAIACGVVCGVAAATPLFLQLKSGKADLGRGFGAVIFAFLLIQVAMFVIHAWWPSLLAAFATPVVLAFLGMTLLAVLAFGS